MIKEQTVPHPFSRLKPSDVFLTLAFFLFFLIQLAHHQVWRDELNVWGLVLASPTFSSLVSHAHYEGHTLPWYLVLWLMSHVTQSQVALKIVEGLVGCGIYYLLGMLSPFSRAEKILIFLSYFVVFEYTVMARMYGSCLLVMLIFLYRRSRHPERYIGNFALLGLLAAIDALGVMLSLPLLAEYAWSTQSHWRTDAAGRRRALSGLGVYVLLLAFALWSGLPARDVSHASAKPFGIYAFDISHLAVAINNAIVVPWLPLPHGFVHGFYWGDIDVQLQLIVLAPVVLLAYWVIFRRQVNLLLLMGLTLCESIAFLHLVHRGSPRHAGIIFLAFLSALWIQRLRRPAISDPAKILLGLSALSGIILSILVWVRPFSVTRQAADWLQAHHLQNAQLVGSWDFSVASIAEELRRPIYFLDCNCSDTFLLFSNRRDSFEWDQIPQRLVLAKKNLGAKELIFISSERLSWEEKNHIADQQLHIEGLAAIDGAGVRSETYYIYKIT